MDLTRCGFHVITMKRFREQSSTGLYPERKSVIGLLKDVRNRNLERLTIVEGLDDFLKTSTDEAVFQAREIFNKAIKEMITKGASIVFVVRESLENVPENPELCGKPLASIFPRPHDIGLMEPGYLCYRII
jgi:hypothetical protein